MKISVVLSTYNGNKFITELMESLKNQTRKIDEVLICDDQSTDSTQKTILDFIADNKLSNWVFIQNEKNKGWKRNFYDGICRATGDLIFTCDQDDIWDVHKIEAMESVIINRPEILLLCCDYKLEYLSGAKKFPKSKISNLKQDNSIEKINARKSLLIVDRPGCTYCITKQLVSHMKKLWIDGYPHDALAWRSAAVYDGLYIYHAPLIIFRRHLTNASDRPMHSIADRIKMATYYHDFLRKMQDAIVNDRTVSMKKIKYIEKCTNLEIKRLEALKSKSILKMLRLATNLCYYPSIKTFLADCFCIIRFN